MGVQFGGRPRMSRIERMQQIATVLYFWDIGQGLTMTQLAFWVGLSPSTHFMDILKSMEDVGLVTSTSRPHRPGIQKFQWQLSESSRILMDGGKALS